jgi:hypothetical protein
MNRFKYLIPVAFFLIGFASCNLFDKRDKTLLKTVDATLDFCVQQSVSMAESLKDSATLLPKTINRNGELETCNSAWWVSGFFPGQLWYMYEYSKDDKLKQWAKTYSQRVANQQFTTDNHDVGFMIFCSFGNGYRITKNEDYLPVLRNAANSLSTRFNDTIGCIRSWDKADWNCQWQYPVIIDNMMNLELLMWSSKQFSQPWLADIAKSHATTTLKNHFRPDGSSFHVVSYDTITGIVEKKQTSQGYSDSSAWARGQAWALYGYTMMFRETGDQAYLDIARKIAAFILNHPNLPDDKIPYWDFNAPDIPNDKRDASAGAIMCSAFIELSQITKGKDSKRYFETAEMQLRSLCSDAYLAKPGENCNFILKHSVGHHPNQTEVDVPLTYADYYFVEALMRYRNLK